MRDLKLDLLFNFSGHLAISRIVRKSLPHIKRGELRSALWRCAADCVELFRCEMPARGTVDLAHDFEGFSGIATLALPAGILARNRKRSLRQCGELKNRATNG